MTNVDLPTGITIHIERNGTIRYRARATIKGRRRSLGLYDTVDGAAAALLGTAVALGDDARGMTLAAWAEIWLERRGTDGIHRAAHKDVSTWKRVEAAHFYNWPLRKIARTDVVRWIRELVGTEATSTRTTGLRTRRVTARKGLGRKLSTQSVRNALGLLRRALGDAADEGHVPANAALGVTVPRRPTSVEPWAYLTTQEIDAVLARKLRPEQRAIFTVAIFTGLRAGELYGLEWQDVVLAGARPELVVRHSYRGPTKGGRVRRVPLLRQAREALKVWRAHAPGLGAALVFPAELGTDGRAGCHAEGFDAGWPRVRKLARVSERVRFHDLRHTCGSHLVMGSWGRAWRLEEVKEMLGHRSITTTERYAHLAPERLHGARAETDRGAEEKGGGS